MEASEISIEDIEMRLKILERMYLDKQKDRIATQLRIKSYVRAGRLSEMEAKRMYSFSDATLRREEEKIAKEIEEAVEQHPLWKEWFRHVKGMGKLLAGQLMGEINIDNTPHPSALWHYAGYHTMRRCTLCGFETYEDIPDGKCPYCGGLIIGTSVEARHGQRLNVNLTLKAITHKIAMQFLRYKGCFYEQIYRKARRREEERNLAFRMNIDFACGYVLAEDVGRFKRGVVIKKKGANKNFDKIKKELRKEGRNWVMVRRTDGHLHMRALRIVKKLFLSHTWEMWRRVRGLPVVEPYPIRFIDHDMYISPEEVIEHDKKVVVKVGRSKARG